MGLLDFVDTTFILTLGIILLISGGIMIYCYRRLNVLENGLIQQGRVIQDFITNYNLNMKDWVAENQDDYLKKAVNFSSDLEKLSFIRKNLRKNEEKIRFQIFVDYLLKILNNYEKSYNSCFGFISTLYKFHIQILRFRRTSINNKLSKRTSKRRKNRRRS